MLIKLKLPEKIDDNYSGHIKLGWQMYEDKVKELNQPLEPDFIVMAQSIRDAKSKYEKESGEFWNESGEEWFVARHLLANAPRWLKEKV